LQHEGKVKTHLVSTWSIKYKQESCCFSLVVDRAILFDICPQKPKLTVTIIRSEWIDLYFNTSFLKKEAT